ncbi:chemotaxis protein CheB [bacterium TMED221]|nr:MAG: chemotaxis protein CheB [bacterium TMED221]
MSDYSIAFISNEAVTRSYANELLTEKWLGSFKVASSINSKRLENFKIDFCLIDTSKNFESFNDLKDFCKNTGIKKIIIFHSDNNLGKLKRLLKIQKDIIIFRKVERNSSRDFFKNQLSEIIKVFNRSSQQNFMDLGKVETSITYDLILLGASTGGPEALKQIIGELKPNMPPILLVLHMQPEFMVRYCERLQRITTLKVKRFIGHEKVVPNSIYIADGFNHMEISKTGSDYFLNRGTDEKIKGHCPSVDVLFNSAARIKKTNLLAILLTGMGSDGAEGLNSLKNSGAFTITQNEETSEVYGMPKAALEIGAANCVLSLEQITDILSLQEI